MTSSFERSNGWARGRNNLTHQTDMANAISLKAASRNGIGRGPNRRLRVLGKVPGVVYGKRSTPANIEVVASELRVALKHSTGGNLLVELQLDGAPAQTAIIQELQRDGVSGAFLHVDLHALAADETFTTSVAIEAHGEPIGVKTYGGLLEHVLREVEVECLPKDLPSIITVDVSELNVGQSLHISDLKLPAGVVVLNEPELVVFAVAAPLVDTDEKKVEGAAAQPEVIKEKKAADAPAEAAKKK